ncbi:uncharacterized protein [Oscarella lobularis]|uniref:uncharacterized protein isoform X2 n=1 Tax=Oscarella lobularis TaxID=121494 RepID=UPI0033141A76
MPLRPASTGRGRGGKRDQVSAPRDEDPEDPEASRPRNLSLLPKQTENLPYAGSPPYQPSYHASFAPTHGFSPIGPQSHGSSFAGSTANRGDANWLIQPGGSGPSQPWLPNPNWPSPGRPPLRPPVQLGPGLPQPRGVYPVRPLGDPRSPPSGGLWYSPPGDPRPPGNLRSPISGGSCSNQSYLSGSVPYVSPPGPSSLWPVGVRPAFSSSGNSLQSESSYNSQNLYTIHSERLQMQQLQLQGNFVSKHNDFVSDAARALEPKENCIILRGLPPEAERQKVTNVVQEAVLKSSSKVEVLELRKEEGGCVAKVHFSNRKGLTTIWKQRHKRKSISYESSSLTFDLLWPEEYEENRFLLENCPSSVSSESFVKHLKAQSILEESKVTPKFIDGGKTAVVFLDDNIVDEEMVGTLNKDASDFEESDAKLCFRRIPVSRSIRLDCLSKEVDKGTLRNYLFGLPTFPPVPLVETVEISKDLHCNSAIVTLRTTAEGGLTESEVLA